MSSADVCGARWRRSIGLALTVATAGSLAAGPSDPGPDVPVIEVVSSRADLVSGGDALLRITVDSDAPPTVRVGPHEVSEVFERRDDHTFEGLVTGLDEGLNRIVARDPAGGASVLEVLNHPPAGPMFSGPHQTPFVCQTDASELGPPEDEDCQAPTRIRWFYLSSDDDTFHELSPGVDAYPADVASTTTTSGRTVPFVVRAEAGTLNRGIHHILVLDDPVSRGWDRPYAVTEGWNERLQYSFGGGCGVGYRQGSQRAGDLVALARGFLSQGYAYASSTLNALGNACNDVLSAETMSMVKERFIETVGEPLYTVGDGGSGGAIMQYMIATGYPGLLDGILPYATFPDNTTVTMSIFDCRLVQRLFDDDPLRWTPDKRTAVTGFATPLVCIDWDELYGDLIVAADGCTGLLPDEAIYDPASNRTGARCTVHDSNRNIYGTDPETGFARSPYDNVGVQYGLSALASGRLLAEDFVVLNETIGGFDVDGGFRPERSRGDVETIRRLYETGKVVSGEGGLSDIPILDQNLYVAEHAAAGLEVHDRIRTFQVRERLEARPGGGEHLLLWTYGTTVPGDWGPLMDAWLTGIASDPDRSGDASDRIRRARPEDAVDRCYPESGHWFEEDAEYGATSKCNLLFPAHGTPRMVAGGPVAEDVLKCRLAPLDREQHPGEFSDAQWARLLEAFPDGVCDWTLPGVGQVPLAGTWLSFGGAAAQPPTPLGPEPRSHRIDLAGGGG